MSRVQVDRNGLQVLNREECLRLLRTATLGRVGVTSDALPAVLPVNFRVNHDRIMFRTGRGTKLDAATRNAVVAFEVDDFDPVSHTGWSVLVTGVAQAVTDYAELAEARALQIPQWAPYQHERVVAISVELISGRRIVHGLAASHDGNAGSTGLAEVIGDGINPR